MDVIDKSRAGLPNTKDDKRMLPFYTLIGVCLYPGRMESVQLHEKVIILELQGH